MDGLPGAQAQGGGTMTLPGTTASGLPVASSLTAAPGLPEAPGTFPYTRGIYPEMYRKQPWTIRQYAGFATAAQSNERYHALLAAGQTGLSVAFDLPTQLGMDSDDPRAEGEVGRVGVAIDSLEDMETLFRGIDMGAVSTSMTINAPASVLLCLYVAAAKRAGVNPRSLRGTVQNDILKEYIARGTYIFPPEPSLRLTTDLMAYCCGSLPKWNPISVSGYHIREAGSTAGEEIGLTLAHGLAYLQAAVDAGLQVDEVAPQMSFFFAAFTDVLEEVAKFRAARRLWATCVRERYAPGNPQSMRMRFHTQTAGSTLTAQQPDNNVVRVALQALAAVLGGTQSLHTNAKDEALSLPTEAAATLALRTQQVIAYESGSAITADPLGGSVLVESLTDRLEEEARTVLGRIEAVGVLEAIRQGIPQGIIQSSAYAYQRQVEDGSRVIVGVNRFQGPEIPHAVAPFPAEAERGQRERLGRLRAQRNQGEVDLALGRLEAAARGDGNLLPVILEAAESWATVGEICGRLQRVFGVYRERVVV